MIARKPGRLLFFLWAGVWIGLVAVLIVFWKTLPVYVSWPLAVVEAIFAPDLKYVWDNYIRKKE